MLSFGNAIGNLFNRLGKIGLVVKQIRSYQDSQYTNITHTANGVVAQYNAESDLQAIIGSSYESELNSTGSIGSTMSNLASATVNRMVFRDNPRLSQSNTTASLTELIRQMKLAGATVLAPTITAVPTGFVGNGDGVIVTSITRPRDGKTLDNAFAETLLLTCTADSYTGSATAGNESMAITGTGAQSNPFAYDWPLGSGVSTNLTIINSSANTSQGNLLANSDFETWNGALPTKFTLTTGTVATHTNKETSLVFGAGNALRLTGDGNTLIQLRQLFGSSTGTTGTLNAQLQYSVNLFLRRDGMAPAAGELTIDLIDGSNNIIQDTNGTNNSFAIDLTALSTVYTGYHGVFRTPKILPATQSLRLRMTTALSDGRSVYLDKMSMGRMTQLYSSGPFVNVHSGSIPFLRDDYATLAVTNSRGSGGTLDTFQTLFYCLFPDMAANEFLLPSSNTPTIDDALIG